MRVGDAMSGVRAIDLGTRLAGADASAVRASAYLDPRSVITNRGCWFPHGG